ncbi:carboxymuconolactone decarboxylase family protein [uncultured Aeromicrobium sp.]|uniref:carboxymuconolactone decarboxylase family protein n=1 Tax=uncultured Aeromicrobium sp. TaxID=337820 RepID=UPI0025D295D8|nr:carboxymuconolactone decarboxylase family protein [uncultured Aeromicrobium sp.]
MSSPDDQPDPEPTHAQREQRLNVGWQPEQIIEAFLHASVYCGFPKALNAVAVARTVFADRGLLPVRAD